MKPLLALALLALPSVALAQPLKVPVQIVQPPGRIARPLFREAKGAFESVGIRLRLDRIVKRRLPRAVEPDAALLAQFGPVVWKLARPGVRTVLLVPPPRDPFGRPLLTAAPICRDWAVLSWPKRHPAERVAWVLGHELGHSLGAMHEVGQNRMNPWVIPTARQFGPRAAGEMGACLAREAA